MFHDLDAYKRSRAQHSCEVMELNAKNEQARKEIAQRTGKVMDLLRLLEVEDRIISNITYTSVIPDVERAKIVVSDLELYQAMLKQIETQETQNGNDGSHSA